MSSTPQLSTLQKGISDYAAGQQFGPIVAALHDNWPKEAKQRKRIETLLPSFRLDDSRLLYEGRLFIPSSVRRKVLELDHDPPAGGNFAFARHWPVRQLSIGSIRRKMLPVIAPVAVHASNKRTFTGRR